MQCVNEHDESQKVNNCQTALLFSLKQVVQTTSIWMYENNVKLFIVLSLGAKLRQHFMQTLCCIKCLQEEVLSSITCCVTKPQQPNVKGLEGAILLMHNVQLN